MKKRYPGGKSLRHKNEPKIIWWRAEYTDNYELEFDAVDDYATAEEYAKDRGLKVGTGHNLISLKKIKK